jgi:alkylation response protein AidB-like acyl-CoA dehydrogenase
MLWPRKGDDFVISGQKSSWVSCGTIAESAALFCAVDSGNGRLDRAVFVLPLNLPGVSRGKPLDKIGQRSLNQGEIFFDEVRIPRAWMAVPPEAYEQAANLVLTNANTGMGTLFGGVARAALELAIDYAKARKQGGVPIVQHQTVRWRLWKCSARRKPRARSTATSCCRTRSINHGSSTRLPRRSRRRKRLSRSRARRSRSSVATARAASIRSRRSSAMRARR